MPDVTTICRRCTECEGQEHHWLSDPRSATNVDDDDDDLPIDKNGDVDEQYVLACKHCPATKPYDPDEEDEDSDYDDEDWDISLMVGRTIVAITGGQDAEGQLTAPSGCVEIILDDGAKVRMSHTQDCCESVELVDIAGDVADLIGSPLTMAEEVSNSDDPHGLEYQPESYTWTFYKFATVKGYVTFRWFGESNGYYSESVTVEHLPAEVEA